MSMEQTEPSRKDANRNGDGIFVYLIDLHGKAVQLADMVEALAMLISAVGPHEHGIGDLSVSVEKLAREVELGLDAVALAEVAA